MEVVKNINNVVENKMQTLVLNNQQKSLEIAKNIIINGGLVAFPTETVYGLGGNALDKESIAKIYKAKGRPSDNPLIVHVCDTDMLKSLVVCIPEKAKIIIDTFMPGPLTVILKKSIAIPDEITNYKDTVGIRIPANETALNFIRTCNVPIAAPSANISGKPSPTSFSHVKDDLFYKIDGIIEDDDSEFGLESSIIDMTVEPPMLLRPGSITVKMIEDVIGPINISPYIINNAFVEDDDAPIAPGMKYTHYSPNAPITIFKGDDVYVTAYIQKLLEESNTTRIGILTNDSSKYFFDNEKYFVLSLGKNLEDFGKNLFKQLREFDKLKVDVIYSYYFDEDDLGFALMNRLKKASGFNIHTVRQGDVE